MALSRNAGFLFALGCAVVLLAPSAVSATYNHDLWFSRINTTHRNPTGMLVVVVPPAYLSKSAMVDKPGWIGADAILQDPGVQATLEATEYWAWMIDQYEITYPWLSKLTYTTKVLGVNATSDDLARASIVVNTAMVADPGPFVFHLGLGYPTYPTERPAYVTINGKEYPAAENSGQTLCTVWNTGFGQEATDKSPVRLRNLVLHEFGHCLGAGHTGESLGADHTNATGVIYDNHPTDVMSLVVGDKRQCLSNLNVMSLAEGYAWLKDPVPTWKPHDAEVYQAKIDYATKCMPSALNRF